MGDFNLLNSDSHSATSEFLDNMISLMLLPIISRPTRVTSSSATLIDNISMWKHHSTCLAMIQLIENITSALDKKEVAIGMS